MQSPVRLQDIADQVGVSRATVSLALRNHPSIPPVTRERIRRVADGLGYRPNPLISALMRHQREGGPPRPTHLALGIVINFSKRGPWRSYLSEDLLTGAAARAAKRGYRLEEFWLGDMGVNGSRLSKILAQRAIPGFIVAPLPAAHGHLRLDWARFSAVAIGYSLVRPALHRVSTNRFQAMCLAMRRLRRLGYARVGLALPVNQDARVDHQWASAFLWEQRQASPRQRVAPLLVRDQDWTERRFRRWVGAQRPDVVLGHQAEVAAWLAKLRDEGGDPVGFVHLWNPDPSGTYAGIYHSPPAIGAAAVDMLVELVQRNERGAPDAPHTLLLDSVWRDGATLRPGKPSIPARS